MTVARQILLIDTNLEVQGHRRLGLAHALLAGTKCPEVLGRLGDVLGEEFKDDPSMIFGANAVFRNEGERIHKE